MQHRARDVLQGGEQQGKGKAEERRQRPRETTEGRREVDPREYTSRPAPFALSSEDRPYTSPSRPSPQAPTLQRSSPQETPRRGGGALGDPVSQPFTPPVNIKARKRPPLGSRTQTPPSWTSTPETLPLQFVGGRAGPNANGLRGRYDDFVEEELSLGATHFGQSSPSEGSDPQVSPQESEFDVLPSVRGDTPRPEMPDLGSANESPSASTQSGSLKKSFASSFAYLLRDRRSDKRLFHKRSQPHQHLRPTASPPPERSGVRRSPSYFGPRIVQDTQSVAPQSPQYDPVSPILTASTVSQLSSTPSESRHTLPSPALHHPHPIQSKRTRERSDSPQTDQLKLRKVRSHSPGPPTPSQYDDLTQKPRLQHSETTLTQRKLPARRALRIDLPSSRQFSRNDIEGNGRKHGFHSLSAAPRDPVREALDREAGPYTPPEILPLSPKIAHGDHYFRTFGEDTVYEKIRPQAVPPRAVPETPPVRPALNVAPDAPETPSPIRRPAVHGKHRKRESVIQALGKLPMPQSMLEAPKSSMLGTPTPMRSPFTSPRGTRASNRSDNSMSSYFGVPRRKHDSSESRPTSPSPMATHWEAVAAESGHPRDDSEPLSPLTRKTPRLKWAQQVVSKLAHEDLSPFVRPRGASEQHASLFDHVTASLASANQQSTYKSSDGKEYQTTALTGPDSLSFLPSEMKRINTPPLKEEKHGKHKLSKFRSFFFDHRSLPAEGGDNGESAWQETPPERKRHAGIVPKVSLQSLMPKLSMPRLRYPTSETPSERRDSDPLAVTNFHQTPFSQRYGDARRAKQTLMRAYVWDETLREDEEGSSSSIGPSFDLSIPDHLTNSPLCPLNEKHRSGGRALCPIHGRKRMSVNAYPGGRRRPNERREATRGGKREPTIVYDSNQQGATRASVVSAHREEPWKPSGFT